MSQIEREACRAQRSTIAGVREQLRKEVRGEIRSALSGSLCRWLL